MIIDLNRPLKLSDLEVGKVFLDFELIVESDEKSMTTIVHDEGFELGVEYDITKFMYDLKVGGNGNVLLVNCNGVGEIFRDDSEYSEDKNKLRVAGLWSNN